MKKKISMVVLMLVFVMALSVSASSTFETYNTTVGRIGGRGYTGFQTKQITGAAADLRSVSVGADYTVSVRMLDSDGNAGEWARDVGDNDNRTLDGDSDHRSGDLVRLEFANDWFTRVNVQVHGTWRSN
ncbi:MAG: hypothetical protein ACLKAN_12890 [Alkaliphilus sp.]